MPPRWGALREREADRAARRLGLAEVAFLRYPDGTRKIRALRGEVVAWLRRWRPAIVFTHDPEYAFPPYLCHRDQRITGRVVLDACYPLARDRQTFPEQLQAGLQPHAVAEAWLFASTAATAFGPADRDAGNTLEACNEPQEAALFRAADHPGEHMYRTLPDHPDRAHA